MFNRLLRKYEGKYLHQMPRWARWLSYVEEYVWYYSHMLKSYIRDVLWGKPPRE